MAFGIVPIMRLSPDMVRMKANITIRSNCMFLAKEMMEDLKGRVFGDFSANYSQAATTFNDTEYADYVNYRYSIADTGNASIKNITLSVWLDGTDDIFTLYTKLANRD